MWCLMGVLGEFGRGCRASRWQTGERRVQDAGNEEIDWGSGGREFDLRDIALHIKRSLDGSAVVSRHGWYCRDVYLYTLLLSRYADSLYSYSYLTKENMIYESSLQRIVLSVCCSGQYRNGENA